MAPEPDARQFDTATPARLRRHPDSRCASVASLQVRVHELRPGVIGVEFTLLGDLGRIRIAPPGPGERTNELWRHTCFETFVRREDVPGYLEFNFSPSGAWQAYHFGGYRQDRMPASLPTRPHVTVGLRERAAETGGTAASPDDALVLEALVHLPAPYVAAPPGLRLGFGVVVEEQTGTLSYWALRHAPGRPDFHHPGAFALALDSR